MLIAIIISVVLSLSALIYAGHCAIVFQRFNDGIREWSINLDNSTRDAIECSARNILRELDAKITSVKEEENPKNDLENE